MEVATQTFVDLACRIDSPIASNWNRTLFHHLMKTLLNNQSADFNLDVGVENLDGKSGQDMDELEGEGEQAEQALCNVEVGRFGGFLSGADTDELRHNFSEPHMSDYPAFEGSEHANGDDRGFEAVSATGSDGQEREMTFNHETTQAVFKQSLPSNTVQHFWERDPFLTSVFGTGNVVDDLFPKVNLKRPHAALVVSVDDSGPEERPIVKALYKGSKRPVYMAAFKHSAIEIEDSKRKAALSGWTTLVLINVDAFTALDDALGHASRNSSSHLTDEAIRDVTQRTLSECFSSKATNTLLKRLGSLRRYVSFCAEVSTEPFPLEEQSMYDFMQALRDRKGVGASTGRSFLEAVRFSGAMLGLRTSGKCMVSRRLAGLGELIAKQTDVHNARLTEKRIWVRVMDPTSSLRIANGCSRPMNIGCNTLHLSDRFILSRTGLVRQLQMLALLVRCVKLVGILNHLLASSHGSHNDGLPRIFHLWVSQSRKTCNAISPAMKHWHSWLYCLWLLACGHHDGSTCVFLHGATILVQNLG